MQARGRGIIVRSHHRTMELLLDHSPALWGGWEAEQSADWGPLRAGLARMGGQSNDLVDEQLHSSAKGP